MEDMENNNIDNQEKYENIIPYDSDHTGIVEYDLEYGSAIVEIHEDAISKGERVIIVDDLIATGGTMGAAIELVERLGGTVVECALIVDLPDLGGKEKLKGKKIFALTEFEGD